MGEDWGSWFPQQQLDWQSSNLNYLDSSFNGGQQYTIPSFMNPGTDTVSIKGMSPLYQPHEPHQTCIGHSNEPHDWFYCLPRFRQALWPALNSGLKGKFPTAPYDNHEAISPKLESDCGQKRFLVFDQSGDHTKLIFGSGIGTTAHCFTRCPNPTGICNLKGEASGTKENLNIHLGAIATDQYAKDNGTDLGSEMHEDTEELNALLYSDDDSDYTEDDEVTSTGHSPSTMTFHHKQDWFEGNSEEVGSCNASIKKRKLFDQSYGDLPALMDTASSVKPARSLEYEDDAESRCDNRINRVLNEMVSESSNKKMRKEGIRETVSILQSIIPCAKGKDAIVIIDDAINYLKSLKLKAKTLGLDAT